MTDAKQPAPHDEQITVRMPVWAFQGIMNGIEKWTGNHWDENEICQPIEFVDIPPSWQIEIEDGFRYLSRQEPPMTTSDEYKALADQADEFWRDVSYGELSYYGSDDWRKVQSEQANIADALREAAQLASRLAQTEAVIAKVRAWANVDRYKLPGQHDTWTEWHDGVDSAQGEVLTMLSTYDVEAHQQP